MDELTTGTIHPAKLHQMAGTVQDLLCMKAKEIEQAVATGFSVDTKTSQGDLVTEIDRQTEKALKGRLRELIRGSSFLGEETGGVMSDGYCWIVDPIDGTANIVHDIPYSSIVIGLVFDGEPVLGVVYNIFERKAYSAVKGFGAWIYNYGIPWSAHEIKVSSAGLQDSILSFGVPYNRNSSASIFEAASLLYAGCRDLRRQGSAGLDLMAVARGSTAGHFERDLRIWDIAGPAMILSEAGAVISDWQGNPVSLDDPAKKINLCVANHASHDEMVAILSTVEV